MRTTRIYNYPSSADCTTATNDGLPERARIKPCRYWLSDFLVRRVLAHRCTSQRIWFTRFNEGPQAHRPLRVIWKNNFDPWALRIFGRHRCLAAVNQCWTQKTPKISKAELADAQAAYDHAREVYTKLIAECAQ